MHGSYKALDGRNSYPDYFVGPLNPSKEFRPVGNESDTAAPPRASACYILTAVNRIICSGRWKEKKEKKKREKKRKRRFTTQHNSQAVVFPGVTPDTALIPPPSLLLLCLIHFSISWILFGPVHLLGAARFLPEPSARDHASQNFGAPRWEQGNRHVIPPCFPSSGPARMQHDIMAPSILAAMTHFEAAAQALYLARRVAHRRCGKSDSAVFAPR